MQATSMGGGMQATSMGGGMPAAPMGGGMQAAPMDSGMQAQQMAAMQAQQMAAMQAQNAAMQAQQTAAMQAQPMGGMQAQSMGGMQAPATSGMQTQPMGGMQAPAIGGVQAQQLAQTPIFSFILNKLTDDTPKATVKEVVQFTNVQQGNARLSFDIKTGEAFAILFATTVPGRVRIINTDASGAVSASDVYEALPGADNRMPRDWQGGIVMSGASGTEYMEVEFTPCLSQQYVNDPRVSPFQGILPQCSQEAATKAYAPALASGKGGVVDSGSKAMVFPASAHPGQPVAVAPADYAKGGVLTFRITVNHQRPA
jgi:hypothetical protein